MVASSQVCFQDLASFKRQQEQGFQEQSALAAEARESRRQELLEKIAEGRAAKKQKLEQDSADADRESPAAGESQAAAESQTSGETPAARTTETGASPDPAEPEEAAQGGSSSPEPGEGGERPDLLGSQTWPLE